MSIPFFKLPCDDVALKRGETKGCCYRVSRNEQNQTYGGSLLSTAVITGHFKYMKKSNK